jgi:hypothetical protein
MPPPPVWGASRPVTTEMPLECLTASIPASLTSHWPIAGRQWAWARPDEPWSWIAWSPALHQNSPLARSRSWEFPVSPPGLPAARVPKRHRPRALRQFRSWRPWANYPGGPNGVPPQPEARTPNPGRRVGRRPPITDRPVERLPCDPLRSSSYCLCPYALSYLLYSCSSITICSSRTDAFAIQDRIDLRLCRATDCEIPDSFLT